ncbi:PH-like domain-containing protein [Streptomyces brevispora]|uniref:PH domain-containing protein n=1 Tax=Streptomyces brevispora TaxID=887462 RepID=A0A561UR74_9ACTN|nr:hypothetical protein [Streptomyces brevispora]TWG01872.1 hypothetical protein FHX80_11264 [Streptomyces brevispora]WSC16926.1 hypothetical protein OIE64_31585 [Streptomyces brevispora]
MTTLTPLYQLAAEQKSAEVTDWSARISWVIGLIVLVAFIYWLMRQGWKWRGSLQSGLSELATTPDGFADGEKILTLTGRYHASTTAGQWLDRIVAHGLGTRSRVELTLTEQGLDVVRPGATDFFVPAADLREARTDKALAGKVLPEGGLLIITWALGDQLIDSGFRSDHSAEHPAWVDAVNQLASSTEGTAR